MNNFKKSAQVFCQSLLFSFVVTLLGACSKTVPVWPPGYISVAPDCVASGRGATYIVTVQYANGCPVGVSFPDGNNGCFPGPVQGDPQPAVCVCAGRNERVGWQAGPDAPDGAQYTVHFSPFGHGSFTSHNNGEITAVPVPRFANVPGNSLVAFKYSITAGAQCAVIDPPIIIRQ